MAYVCMYICMQQDLDTCTCSFSDMTINKACESCWVGAIGRMMRRAVKHVRVELRWDRRYDERMSVSEGWKVAEIVI